MNTEQFFDQFGHFIEAPNGIQKLREMILQLAVRGDLVKQDPNDEPAGELLKRIKAEKTQNMAKNRFGRLKQLPYQEIVDPAFDLAEGWEWALLDEITFTVHYGYTASADHGKKDVRLLRITDIQDNKVDWPSVPGCEITEKSYAANALNEGDILIARTGGTIGKTYIVENLVVKAVFASYLIRAIPSQRVVSRYLKTFMETPLYWEQLVAKSAGTGQPNVNATSLRALQVPVPPYQEQHRIVAKVDELMALCDQLEAERNARQATHQRLIRAVHHPLTEAADTTAIPGIEQHPAWRRIRDNFADLYTTLESVQALRQTILQLAVQGRLVPQDERDDRASSLLELTNKTKNEWIKNKKIKKPRPLQELNIEDMPYVLPSRWEWVYMDEIFSIGGGIQKQPKRKPVTNHYPYLGVRNVYRGRLDLGVVKRFELFEGELEKWKLEAGDLLVVEGNGSENEIGRCAIWTGEIDNCVHQNHLIRCRPFDSNIGEFVLRFLNSPTGMDEMKRLAITTSGLYNLSVGKIKGIALPIPPLQEQHRIVAKVDELMTLCDQLEANIRTKNTTATRYAEAIVRQIAAA